MKELEIIQLKSSRVNSHWEIREYDNERYKILMRIESDTGKLAKIFFTAKSLLNPVSIVNPFGDEFYISIDELNTVFLQDIDKFIDNVTYAKNLIIYMKAYIADNFNV